MKRKMNFLSSLVFFVCMACALSTRAASITKNDFLLLYPEYAGRDNFEITQKAYEQFGAGGIDLHDFAKGFCSNREYLSCIGRQQEAAKDKAHAQGIAPARGSTSYTKHQLKHGVVVSIPQNWEILPHEIYRELDNRTEAITGVDQSNNEILIAANCFLKEKNICDV